MMAPLAPLGRRLAALVETVDQDGTEDSLADALEVAEQIAGELDDRIRELVTAAERAVP